MPERCPRTQRRARAWLPLVVAALLFSACGGQAPDTASGTPAQAGATGTLPVATDPPPTDGPTPAPPATFAPVIAEADPVLLAALMADGLSEADAELFATTAIVTEQQDPLHYRVLETFATGDQLELSVAIEANSGPPVAPAFTSATTADGVRFSYRFAVDLADAPAELTDALAVADLGELLAAAAGGPVLVAAGGDSTVRVLIDGSLRQAAKEAFRQVFFVKDAAENFRDVKGALDALGALEDCVNAPSDPAVRKQFQEFPGDRQLLLDQIRDAVRDVQRMGAVMQLGPATKSGAAVANLNVLSFIIARGFTEANNQLLELIAARVAEIAGQVTPCKKKGGWTTDRQSGSIRMSGQKCGSLGGTWKARQVQELSGQRLVVNYTFVVDEVTLTGTWKLAMRVTSPGIVSTANASGQIGDVELRDDGHVLFLVEWPPTIRQKTVVLTDPPQTFVSDLPMPDGFPFNWRPTPTGCD